VKATGNAGTLQGLVLGVPAADSHEARHLNLGELNLAAAKGSQRLKGVNMFYRFIVRGRI
jgi:hypothetical protein